MKLPQYDITQDETPYTYQFISEGKRGKIYKIVIFQETEAKGFFNLGFGDKDNETGELLDDTIVSDNGDSEKVLATVVAIVYLFTDENPDAYIYAEGSTPSRNRLYRKGITKFLKQALKDFYIYGLVSEEVMEPFDPNGNYIGFLVHRKKQQSYDSTRKKS